MWFGSSFKDHANKLLLIGPKRMWFTSSSDKTPNMGQITWSWLLLFLFLPAEFWSALGGKKEYQTSKSLQNMVKPPRLFGCSNKTGRLIVGHTVKWSPGPTCTETDMGNVIRCTLINYGAIQMMTFKYPQSFLLHSLRLKRYQETSHSLIWPLMMSWSWIPGTK